jgi:NTP pyrophosphatase (non-canonical NTP hydrolase)
MVRLLQRLLGRVGDDKDHQVWMTTGTWDWRAAARALHDLWRAELRRVEALRDDKETALRMLRETDEERKEWEEQERKLRMVNSTLRAGERQLRRTISTLRREANRGAEVEPDVPPGPVRSIAHYQGWAETKEDPNRADRIRYARLSLFGELGELAEVVKKVRYHGMDPSKARERKLEELGDVLWSIAALATAQGVNLANLIGMETWDEMTEHHRTLKSKSADPVLTYLLSVTAEKETPESAMYLVARLCRLWDIDLKEVVTNNVRKLNARYPGGFVQGGGNR